MWKSLSSFELLNHQRERAVDHLHLVILEDGEHLFSEAFFNLIDLFRVRQTVRAKSDEAFPKVLRIFFPNDEVALFEHFDHLTDGTFGDGHLRRDLCRRPRLLAFEEKQHLFLLITQLELVQFREIFREQQVELIDLAVHREDLLFSCFIQRVIHPFFTVFVGTFRSVDTRGHHTLVRLYKTPIRAFESGRTRRQEPIRWRTQSVQGPRRRVT